ncbi:MAG TPA: ABC transporter ATP-binding protein [Chitinispirillaceae bacterium]|nr:ABC transporter ATP-binding protein [Chitinispirillaceae bacterium]
MNVIELKNISKTYRKGLRARKIPAVVNLTFSVKKNRVTGFVGPNGAGKTTTIKMITGLVRQSSGTVKINGIESFNPQSRQGVSYLSEQPCFYGHLTVNEALGFAANLLRISGKRIGLEIDRVLDIVEMVEKKPVKVKELSKGMQQRINMAQVLLGNPHTMVLDEPMSGMDPPGRKLFRSIFTELKKQGVTVFFSTHVLDDIEAICDDVIVLSKGELVYDGSVMDLLDTGRLGMEMVVFGTVKDEMESLNEIGCIVTEKNNNSIVFVPKDKDYKLVQHLLFSKGKSFVSIKSTSKSLQDLLYHNPQKQYVEHKL